MGAESHSHALLFANPEYRHESLCRCEQGEATLRMAERSSSPGKSRWNWHRQLARCGCLGIKGPVPPPISMNR